MAEGNTLVFTHIASIMLLALAGEGLHIIGIFVADVFCVFRRHGLESAVHDATAENDATGMWPLEVAASAMVDVESTLWKY